MALAAAIGFVYAAWRADARLSHALPSAFEGRDLQLVGAVQGLPQQWPDARRFLFRIEACHLPDGRTACAPSLRRVRLGWYRHSDAWRAAPQPGLPALAPGQRWRLTVRLKRPHGPANPGSPDLEALMLQRDIQASGYVRHGEALGGPRGGLSWRDRLDRWRGAVIERIGLALTTGTERAQPDAAMPSAHPDNDARPPEQWPLARLGGVLAALSVGERAALDRPVQDILLRTDTGHLLSISGMHVGMAAAGTGIAAAFVWRRARWRGRPLPLYLCAQHVAVWAGLLGAAAYVMVSGMAIPAQRAFWMLAFASLALGLRRRLPVSVTLAWAVGLVLLVDPWAPLAAAFWFSFLAVSFILLAIHRPGLRATAPEPHCPPRHARAAGAARAERLMQAARVQLAATFGLLPLGAYYFSRVSLIGPLANALAIPCVTTLVTPLTLLGVLLPEPVARWAFQASAWTLRALLACLDRLSRLEWAAIDWPMPTLGAVILACVGCALCCMRLGRWPVALGLLCWLPMLRAGPAAPPPGEFRLTALDVGQGGGVVVETSRHRLLFDAGPPMGGSDAGERIVLPFLRASGIRALDMVLISHSHADHVGGARSVIEAFPVAALNASLPRAHGLFETARQRAVEAYACVAGQRWQWDGVSFETLWPSRAHDAGDGPNSVSCVLRIDTGRVAALLPGDIERPQELAMLARSRSEAQAAHWHAAIVIAPHHGSRTSSSDALLRATRPREVVFQAGYRNRHRHPHIAVERRYRRFGARVHRSDHHGAVRFETQGREIRVERYREAHRRYWTAWPKPGSRAIPDAAAGRPFGD